MELKVYVMKAEVGNENLCLFKHGLESFAGNYGKNKKYIKRTIIFGAK